MQIDVKTKSKSLLGISDLTLVATIKRGLIPALDSRSYETRLSLLTKTLNTLRISSLEAEPTPLIGDAIDRIRSLHSFRLAIVGQESRQLLLAVTFDGGWESYMRRIWRDLGPLLDVIFCNCEGYLLAHDHTFAAYTGWVRSAQVGTEFFYNASSLTVNDLYYLRESERQRNGATAQKAGADKSLFEQALPALTALYRLTDMYPPDHEDGACLRRAAVRLLPEFAESRRAGNSQIQGRTATERAALRWFDKPPRLTTSKDVESKWEPNRVQGGIVKTYERVTHACLLMIQLKGAAAAVALLDRLRPEVTRGSTQDNESTHLFVNLSFTFQGMQVVGVPKGTLDQLPFEFREGMEARAGILGDLRHNHPTSWSLPLRNWPEPSPGGRDGVQLSSVHAIVQFTLRGKPSMKWNKLDGAYPLGNAIAAFEKALAGHGVRILSVQAMQRFIKTSDETPRDHFGFIDGISQPDPDAGAADKDYAGNAVVGDLLLGYRNSLRDPPLTGRLWDDSTFLVIRKLKQDVEALNAALAKVNLDADYVKARLMGRDVEGKNLLSNSAKNRFNYNSDPDGAKCPLYSHIRRANPRGARPDLVTTPRIMRRGMSYGSRYSDSPEDDDRGIVFMAYNASIAEQFEVIQSWLSGGNSGGQQTYSAQHDPFLGVPKDDDPRAFALKDDKGVEHRVQFEADKPLVRLEWGTYAFVPSLKALAELHEIAREAADIEAKADDGKANERKEEGKKKKEDRRKIQLAVEGQKGAVAIGRLKLVEQALGFEAAKAQWKIALEDVGARMTGVSQSIWTAVRELHGGVLRTPYGVLVCSKKQVMEVFQDGEGRYTADGYADRMGESFGKIYLGRDKGEKYKEEATKPNEAIQKVTIREGFDSAFKHTQAIVTNSLQPGKEMTVDVDVKDIIDEVLAAVSKEWFALPDDHEVIGGGWHWLPNDPPTCPGHFHSPSRYMFQPNPGTEATEAGKEHGKALNRAVRKFVDSHLSKGTKPDARGRLGSALFTAIQGNPARLTSTLIGVMMGFLPTVDGNLRSTLYEWTNDRSLWDFQIDYLADLGAAPSIDKSFASANRILLPPMRRTMQLRPIPELTWRFAKLSHKLGPVDVNPGDLIVLSIVSASQECLINEEDDLYPIFGGDRGMATHPTHACPGYKMAIGVMLGTLAALMESAFLKPTFTPMALRLSRRT